jgi:hypothetical protein
LGSGSVRKAPAGPPERCLCGSRIGYLEQSIHLMETTTAPFSRFFTDPLDYAKFLAGTRLRTMASDYSDVFVTLEKKGDHFLCIAQVPPNGMYVGDYVKPFRATQENIDIFNLGVNILVERLAIYRATNDLSMVPEKPPAFGTLTHVP